MEQKKWFIINENNEIVTKMFDSYKEAMEVYQKLVGKRIICETVYG